MEALGFEFFGVGAPEVFAAVRDVDAVVHFGVRGDDHGALAVRAAAAWKGGDLC